MADYFVDEFLEPDELIQVGNNLYGVIYMATSSGGSLPIYIRVDEPSMLKPGVEPDMVFETVDDVEEYNGEYVFMDYALGYSEVMTLAELSEDNTSVEKILRITQDQLEYNAKTYGDHYLDLDIQYAFALAGVLGLQTVPPELLAETNWYKNNPSDAARAWAEFEFSNPDEAADIIRDNLQVYKLEANALGLSGPELNNLVIDLNTYVTSGKITKSEADNIVKNLSDSARMASMGGISAIHEDFQKYVGKINQTKNGYSRAEQLVMEYGGPLLLDGYRSSGKLDAIAAELRVGAEFGTTATIEDKIKEDLQKAADSLYAFAKGSKYIDWSASFESLTKSILGQKGLTEEQKIKVARNAQRFQGDYQAFETSMYKDYIDTPYIQEEILSAAARNLDQDISGVFNASTIYRR
tara:strand:- start:128 stop:1357 length:1230 start_codon:yes stop_codon:yes gene_type:complete